MVNIKEYNNRSTNFELLRVLSMLLIVVHHYAIHGGFNIDSIGLFPNKYFIQLLLIGGKIGVNVFILISGYFLINSHFKLSHTISLFVKTSIFSAFIILIVNYTAYNAFTLKDIYSSLFPIFANDYWFITAYFVLYLFADYINLFLLKLNKQTFISFLLLSCLILSVFPTIKIGSMAYSDLFWFLFLYSIGAYIQIYNFSIPLKKVCFYLISSLLFVAMSILVFDYFGNTIMYIHKNELFFTSMEKLPILMISIFLFIIFKQISIKKSNFINLLGSCMLGVYLIHDNKYLRPIIWIDIFKNSQFYESAYLFIHAIVTITIVFTVSTCISMLYEVTLSLYIQRFSIFVSSLISKKSKSLLDRRKKQ